QKRADQQSERVPGRLELRGAHDTIHALPLFYFEENDVFIKSDRNLAMYGMSQESYPASTTWHFF
ncbi:MAG: hypothetical protein LUF30_05335, partial [Lachnospiraceae bacterium]|nr:hypothetical protein [Lachnospiraceae bacterium]